MAEMAYMEFSVQNVSWGFLLKFVGFSDSLGNLVEEALNKFLTFDPLENMESFENLKKKYLTELANFYKEPPY
mgnify:CR=1 FL=1|jgi:secreted Zn-dependent insulinase-like peptidase